MPRRRLLDIHIILSYMMSTKRPLPFATLKPKK